MDQRLTSAFDGIDGAHAPASVEITARQVFYHLVNVEEHPEVLPLALDLAQRRLGEGASAWRASGGSGDDGVPKDLDTMVARLTQSGRASARPWRHDTAELTRRQVLHYFRRFTPTALVDGCWLQGGFRVGTAFTPVGAALTGLYAHQLRTEAGDPDRHFVADYRATAERMFSRLEEVSSHSFAMRADLDAACFGLPNFLLAIAQFTRGAAGEVVGVNLAWQHLALASFGPDLIEDVCDAYGLPPLGTGRRDTDHLAEGRRKARAAAELYLERAPAGREKAWEDLVAGAGATLVAWTEWFEHGRRTAPMGPADPRQEMIDLLERKAPHAHGYHSEKSLGERRIDEHLDPASFDGPALLDALARSRWVQAGRADRSALVRGLVKFGGPMLAVFSPKEIEIIQNWIESLPPKQAGETVDPGHGDPAAKPTASTSATTRPKSVEAPIVSRGWTREAFQQRSQARYAGITTREIFYYLTNIEDHPDILPVAERFTRDRLERSMAMLFKGERPIPSRRYDPAALERWVYAKHRQQVDAYRPIARRPPVSKEAFIEVTVQLAPIVLIDGGWLQGVPSPALIHTEIGRMLFHVLVEEIGAGDAREHHANVYRDLLRAMGEDAPPVDSWEFARWTRLDDASFEVPTLWLSLSCFPRHFLPEIIGLNLAVELAGIGGPYMEARDTLRSFGLPTLFVDVHNAADNVAAGHSAWAMNTIKRYIDEVAEREGPHRIDHAWHRVWSGVRATLPQIGRFRLMLHRMRRRIVGVDRSAVPLIFPS